MCFIVYSMFSNTCNSMILRHHHFFSSVPSHSIPKAIFSILLTVVLWTTVPSCSTIKSRIWYIVYTHCLLNCCVKSWMKYIQEQQEFITVGTWPSLLAQFISIIISESGISTRHSLQIPSSFSYYSSWTPSIPQQDIHGTQLLKYVTAISKS